MKAWTMLFLFSGCSLIFRGDNTPPSAKGERYSVQFSKELWKQKEVKKPDYVFENEKDGRILLANSFCGEYQDDKLEILAEKTFGTVGSFKTESSTYTDFQGREAYRMEGRGTVDGVPVVLRLLNTRRDNCYYDFVSISPEGTARFPDEDFNSLLGSVEFE